MKITTCNYSLPRVVTVLFTFQTDFYATIDDPCPNKIDNNIDMCTHDNALEDETDGSYAVDSVILRIMRQDANCSCTVSLNYNTRNNSVHMCKYQNLQSATPESESCGLAVDVDYSVVPGTTENVDPIKCTSGTSPREIILQYGNAIELKSRIIGGNFTRGYCLWIYREYQTGQPEVLQIKCKENNRKTAQSTNSAAATTTRSNDRQSTEEVTSTSDALDNNDSPQDGLTGTAQQSIEDQVTNSKSSVINSGDNREDQNTDMYIYIGAGAGVVLMIILILMIILCASRIRLKKTAGKEKQTVNYCNDPHYDYGGLKDNILYISAEEQDIVEDGIYNTVDLEQMHTVNQSTDSHVEYSLADGKYSSIGTTDNSPDTRNKPKPAVNFAESDKQRQHISTCENSNNEYAVVDKGRQYGGAKHATPLGRIAARKKRNCLL